MTWLCKRTCFEKQGKITRIIWKYHEKQQREKDENIRKYNVVPLEYTPDASAPHRTPPASPFKRSMRQN
jgi:hypothetical protein